MLKTLSVFIVCCFGQLPSLLGVMTNDVSDAAVSDFDVNATMTMSQYDQQW